MGVRSIKPIAGKLNQAAMAVAEWVHIGEIVVILAVAVWPGRSRAMVGRVSPDRLLSHDCADISPQLPAALFQGRNHGD
jgi:hypothetical protein